MVRLSDFSPLRLFRKKPLTRKLKQLSKGEAHQHWLNDDKAQRYASADPQRSLFLVEEIARHLPATASINEIGCNAGRNLHYLYRAGFTNLSAVEISSRAIEVLRSTFPELSTIPIVNAAVEEVAKGWKINQFDLTFTMAVLLHIHPDSDWVLRKIAKSSRHVFVIETEAGSHRHIFPRDYHQIFTSFGATQIAEYKQVPGLDAYTGRLFETSSVR